MALGGKEITISEMRNNSVQLLGQTYRLAPPAHPNCRGAVSPVVGGDADALDPLDVRLPTDEDVEQFQEN